MKKSQLQSAYYGPQLALFVVLFYLIVILTG